MVHRVEDDWGSTRRSACVRACVCERVSELPVKTMEREIERERERETQLANCSQPASFPVLIRKPQHCNSESERERERKDGWIASVGSRRSRRWWRAR